MKWLLRSAFCTALDPVVYLLDTSDPNRPQKFDFEAVAREPVWAEDANGKIEGLRVLYFHNLPDRPMYIAGAAAPTTARWWARPGS